MEITTRTVGKCKILDLSGNIRKGPDSDVLHTAIREAAQDGISGVVLNLEKVPRMDAAALGDLVSGLAHVEKKGGHLSLLKLDPYVYRLLSISKLLPVFDVFDDEQKALEGCGQVDIEPEKEEQ